MDPATPYYYALSTLAQCAAALAALIGFLSLWWWDRLREKMERSNRVFLASRSPEQFESGDARLTALQNEQRLLLRALRSFLTLTLTILVVAIVLIMFVDVLSIRVWTSGVLKGIIGLMSLCLGVGPFYMVRKAVGSLAAIGTLALLLLASPALAGPMRCQTHHEPTLTRFMTLCDDGTRAVSTWSSTLQRWQTTITESPPQGRTCTPHQTGRGLEVRCR